MLETPKMISVKIVKWTIAWKTNFADLVKDAKSVADFSPSRQLAGQRAD